MSACALRPGYGLVGLGGSGAVLGGDEVFLAQHVAQQARLVHVEHDVAAADEAALDEDLRDGGPIGEELDFLADVLVVQDVDGGEAGQALIFEDLADRPAEPALQHSTGT